MQKQSYSQKNLLYPNISYDYYGVLKYSEYIFEFNSETIKDRGLRITVSIFIITQITGHDISTSFRNSHLNLGLKRRVENALMVKVCHNMACHCHGAADDYLRLHAQTHCLMKYFVRHKYGVSKDFNTFDLHPWHGAGQGAVDAALHYIVLSDSLIDAYNAKVQPWTILDPMLTLPILKSLKTFIDDVVMLAGSQTL